MRHPVRFVGLQIQQIVIVIIPSLPSTNDNLLLLLVIRHGIQQLLQLVLSYFLAQLSRSRQHDQSVFDLSRALLLDEPDPAQSVRRLWVQNLVEDRLFCFRCFGECVSQLEIMIAVVVLGCVWAV